MLLLQRVRLHMQLSPSALSTLLQLSSAPLDDGEEADLSNVRIDIYRGGKAAIHYFNNIEKVRQSYHALCVLQYREVTLYPV